MQRVELVVVQLEEVRRHVEIGRIPQLRLAHILLDSAVELIRQNPQEEKQFVEAPGKKLQHQVESSQFSDANREASAPHSTGDQPTPRPGNADKVRLLAVAVKRALLLASGAKPYWEV